MFGLANGFHRCGEGFSIVFPDQSIGRRRAEQCLQVSPAKGRAGRLGSRKCDSLGHRAVGAITGHAVRTPLRVPQIASAVHNSAVRPPRRLSKVQPDLRIALRPAIGLRQFLTHDLTCFCVALIRAGRIGGKTDCIADGDFGEQLAHLTSEVAINGACIRFGVDTHRADPKTAPRVGAPVV